jgi:PAS domain S-box-containing protein
VTPIQALARNSNLLSGILLAVGLLVLFSMWSVGRQAEVEERRLVTQVTGEQIQLRLASCVRARVDLINSLAEANWRDAEHIDSGWLDRTAAVYPLLPGVQALNYVAPDWQIKQVYPRAPNLAALGANLKQHPSADVQKTLLQAEAGEALVRTDIIDLLQSGKGFVLYKKIVNAEGDHLGFVNGVFRTADLMESCLPEAELARNFQFEVLEGSGELVYARVNSPKPWPDAVVLPLEVADRPWDLVLAPTDTLLSDQDHYVHDLFLFLAALLMLIAFYATRSIVRQQNDLKVSQDKYRLLVENQNDMVVKVNMEQACTYVSPSYCNCFGKSEAELVGAQFLPLVHKDDREATERSLASLAHPPHESYHEQRAMTKVGWRWLAWSCKGVLNDDGELEAITAVGRDITEIKALRERMAQTDKMRAIGELAGGITHDFNNLLQVMIGNLEFLLDQAENKATVPLLTKVKGAVERAMELTDKLAGLSRQHPANREVVDFNERARDFTELMAKTLPESISLNVMPAEQPLYVRADFTQLERVVLNLLFNARDAIIDVGSIEVKLQQVSLDSAFCRAHPGLKPGAHAQLSIVDTGVGISEQDLKKVFDPFYTTKGPGEGSGLGLANCFTIIEQHHGAITVTSAPGQGSTFSVYLPLSELDVREDSDAKGAGEWDPSLAVLVVDDSEEVRDLACAQLHQRGYKTLQAEDGLAAVMMFREHAEHIGLVLLDVVMPKLDGHEAASQILAIDPDIPLIFMSGYSPDRDDMTEPVGPLLKKPFKGEELIKLVEEILISA